MHRKIISAGARRWLVRLGLSALLLSTQAAARESVPDATSREALRADIRREIEADRLTGIALALVKDGRIVWEDGFGWADRAAHRPADAHTAFSVASTTKPFTTTALMTLVADGRLDLDRPANDYLGADKIVDACGPAPGATLRRLATHSSGLPTFFAMYPEGGSARQPAVASSIRDYGHLVAPPGERYEYSNLGMAILAEIVARTSGQPFGTYLSTRVFDPLDMHDSFFDTDVARRGEMAVRYDDSGTSLPFYLTATPGSGELYASAHDLARFAMLHLGGEGLPAKSRILERSRLDALHRPETSVAPGGYGYGMGWQVLQRPGEPDVLYHGGGQSGVKTEFVLLPADGVAAIVLSNRRGPPGFIAQVRDRMLRMAVPDWVGLPDPATSPSLPVPAAPYAGTWRGTMRIKARQVTATLVIHGPADATLSVDDGPPRAVADLALVDGRLSGEVRGAPVGDDAVREGADRLAIDLKLRGGMPDQHGLDGEIVAWRKDPRAMAMFPYWTRLVRQPVGGAQAGSEDASRARSVATPCPRSDR